MPLLRLRQFVEGEGRYRVAAEYERDGVRRRDESPFEFQFTAQDQEGIQTLDLISRIAKDSTA